MFRYSEIISRNSTVCKSGSFSASNPFFIVKLEIGEEAQMLLCLTFPLSIIVVLYHFLRWW